MALKETDVLTPREIILTKDAYLEQTDLLWDPLDAQQTNLLTERAFAERKWATRVEESGGMEAWLAKSRDKTADKTPNA